MSEILAGGNLDPGIWRMLGNRWTLQVLKSVGSKEAVRFNEIKKALAGISSTMLSKRLLELEHEGLVAKNIHGSSKVEYSLTASARELEFMLTELDRWWSTHCKAYQSVIANYQ